MTNSQMQVKEVNFNGDRLVAIQDAKNIIWAGVRAICQNIGFSKNQIDNQIDKINNDIVLSQGAGNFPILTKGGEQVTLCILIDFLPLWLAKISITPTMKKNNPKLVEKLIAYQLKAKAVLAAAFLPQQNEIQTTPQSIRITNPLLEQAMMSLQQSQQNLIDCTMAQGYQLDNHEARLDQHEEYIADLNQFKQEVKAEIKQMELLTKEDQELKGVNLIPKLAVQDVVKLNYQEFASKARSLVIDLSSKRKEVAGHTYKYLYNLIYSNRENWHDMAEAVSKQGLMGFNIENTKLIYEHLPLRKTYVKTLLAALYN